ncbi:MAG: GWxTD domain-containing protein, partial [Candidatus Eiseniibacteriota bacterium]
VAALAAALAWTGVASARDPFLNPHLPWRAGDRLPLTLDAAIFPDSAGLSLEVYVRVPPSALASATPDTSGMRELTLEVRLRSPGGQVRSHEETITASAADTAFGFGRVVAFRFPTRPGTQHVRVRLEDIHSRKQGIIYAGRDATIITQTDGEFQSPKPQMNRQLSDIEFVWDEVSPTGAGVFRRDTLEFLPNPERLYGLYAPDLRFLFTARSHDSGEWNWVARVLDPHGRVLIEQPARAPASPTLQGTARLDVSTLPAGGYDLEIKAWQDGDEGALMHRSRFSVAWKAETWTSNASEQSDLVHLLLDTQSEESFAQLEPGERERFFDDYWLVRDPTPGTAMNEALAEFRKRVDFANRAFTRPGRLKGMFTDMGRVYIRYGPPDEITKEVLPAGNQTLDQELDEIAATESRPAYDVREPGLGGDMRPYELWIYEGTIPTPLETDPRNNDVVRHKRLKFLFVDEQGYGDYVQRYSTE